MKTWNRVSRVSFSLLFLAVFANGSYGQENRVNNYLERNFTASWTDIEATGTPFIYDGGGGFVDGYATISLPFDFPYDSSIVRAGTLIGVATDGFIDLLPNIASAGPRNPSSNYANADTGFLGDSSSPGLICPYQGFRSMVQLPTEY